jgi:hypothetical protein
MYFLILNPPDTMNYILTISLLFIHILPSYAQVLPYPDNSFTIEEYVEQNIPSPNEDWNEAEMKKFIKYMGKIQVEDKWSLPRKDSPYSGELFKKMVNISNLASINDKNISIEDRLNSIETHMAYSNFVIMLYKENHRKTERFGREVLASFKYLVYTARSVRLFFDELKNELPASTTQSSDFKNVHSNATNQLADLMNMILLTFEKDTKRYDYTDLSSFATDSHSTISENWSLISSSQKTKLMTVINKLQQHSNRVVALEMKQLYLKLKK